MFDLYAFPYETLGLENIPSDAYEKAEYLERAVTDEIGDKFGNMVFNLVLHEFEGLLFADVSAFENIANSEAMAILRDTKATVPTPEHINESPETAPSKRIAGVIPDYSKVTDGIDIAEQIGIDKIISECRHFAKWIARLTAWAREGE